MNIKVNQGLRDILRGQILAEDQVWVAAEEWEAVVEVWAAEEEEWVAEADVEKAVAVADVTIEVQGGNLPMKIAVPIWNDKISPVFDTASRLLIINTKNLSEIERFEIYLGEQDISKRCLLIHSLKVNVLICGAISRSFSMMLMSTGVKIISEISGLAEDVLQAYLHGSLSNSKYLMPGCKTNISEQINDNL